MIEAWLRAFLLTQTIEMGVYAHASGSRPLRERLAIAFGASAITHPIVWFVIPEAVRRLLAQHGLSTGWQTDWWVGIAVAETFAFSAEAIWLALFGVRPAQAAAASLLANGASFTLGLFLYENMGW